MRPMPNFLLVMIGGAIGAGLRHGVGLAAPRLGEEFPWGTFIVNLTGGLFAGLLLGFLLSRGAEGEPWRLFLGVGLLGGFTTFSAFGVETIYLFRRGEQAVALGYVASSVAGGILGVWLGMSLVRARS